VFLRERFDGPVRYEIPNLDVVTIVVVRDDYCVGVVNPTAVEVARQPYSSCLRLRLPVNDCEAKHDPPGVGGHQLEMTIRKEILWECETATDAEVRKKEVQLILEHRSNDPAVGYNRSPRFAG
jgi:hypothetical protein